MNNEQIKTAAKELSTPYEVHGLNIQDVKIGHNVFINDKIGIVEKISDKMVLMFQMYELLLSNGQVIKIFRRDQ